jgi:hypothetical protein
MKKKENERQETMNQKIDTVFSPLITNLHLFSE